MKIEGKEYKPSNPQIAMEAGIVLFPAGKRCRGLIKNENPAFLYQCFDNLDHLAGNMVGRDMKQVYPVVEKQIGEKVLYSINHLSCAGFVRDVNIELHEGECR